VPVDAVILDWDDTIVDWLDAIRRAVPAHRAERLLEVVAERCWTRSADHGGAVLLRDTWRFHELPHEVWPHAFPDESEAVLAREIFACRQRFTVDPFEDAWDALDAVRDELGIAVAVLSNNPYLDAEVQRLDVAHRFEQAIALSDPAEKKPAPTGFRRAAAALGLPPERCAYVGDSIQNDALGAHAAGMVSIWLDRHTDSWTPPEGIHRIGTLTELPTLLRSLP
jgi:putative hydrolase of the HAD superfamily